MVRAIGQVLRVPASIWATAHWLPAAGIVGGGRGAGHTVFSGWHGSGHGHHVHLHTAQFLDQIVDEEAEHQLNGNLGQDQSLGGLKTDQSQQNWHDNLQFELHEQQKRQEEFVLVLLLSTAYR